MAQLKTGTTIGGNTAWHAGNDGAASGLDADLLDGQQGSYFLDWTNVTNKPAPVITLGGDLTGSVTLTDLTSGTLTATIAANSVALGTDTTGNYIATVAGTANQITVTGSGSESAAVTLSLPQDIATTSNVTFNTVTLAGELRGPATLIIDPAVIGDNTGVVEIRGTVLVGTSTDSGNEKLQINGLFRSTGMSATPQSVTVTGATTNLDLSLADHWHLTLQANTTFTISNASKKIGSSGMVLLKQDATGGRTFTKATEMKTPRGGATIDQVTTANSISILTYYVYDANTLLINYIGNFA